MLPLSEPTMMIPRRLLRYILSTTGLIMAINFLLFIKVSSKTDIAEDVLRLNVLQGTASPNRSLAVKTGVERGLPKGPPNAIARNAFQTTRKIIQGALNNPPKSSLPPGAIPREQITVFDIAAAQNLMKSLDVENTEDIVIRYTNFSLSLPLFNSIEDRDVFLRSPRNRECLEPLDHKRLTGKVSVVRDGTFALPYDCGWQSDLSYLQAPRRPVSRHNILVPLIVPMAYIFQHFMDGTLPKIIQAYEFIMRPGVQLLLELPHSSHMNIKNVIADLGIPEKKIIWHERADYRTIYGASYMIFTCVAPPLHPELWRDIRKRLQVPEERLGPWNEGTVVFYVRAGVGGRRVKNSNDILNHLQLRYGKAAVQRFDGHVSYEDTVKLFKSARLVIGPHGGGLYNIMFSPRDTVILEFGPYIKNGTDITGLAHTIFWRIADLIGQQYWRMPAQVLDLQKHSMAIDIPRLTSVLDKIDHSKNSSKLKYH